MTYISRSGDLPYILKTVWYINTILWDYESVWPDVRSKNKCSHCDQYFMVLWFCLISWKLLRTVWCINIILLDHESVWQHISPQNKCRSLWPIFHGPVIFPYILKSIEDCLMYEHHTLGLSQYDPMSDLKIFIGHCDLYFIVQWFCLISWRLFDVWTLYFVIMSQCNGAFALKQCRSQWSIFSWSSDFALYLK